ncbi:MAG: hypothetical protein K6G50_00525 [bacterium]|nr:hypothetical protein [bacterium]
MEKREKEQELCQEESLSNSDNSANSSCSDSDKNSSFKGWKRFARYDENGKLIHEDVPLPPKLQKEWDKGMQEWFEDEYSSPEDQNYWRQRLIDKNKGKS